MPAYNSSQPDVADIEDIVKSELEEDRIFNRKQVTGRVRKSQKIISGKETDKYEQAEGDSYIPGTQKIYVKTWGCSHNNSDSEYMAGQLAAYGFTITENKENADLWLLNSCTVKSPAEDHFRNEITAAQKQNKRLVLAGCVPQGQPYANYMQVDGNNFK